MCLGLGHQEAALVELESEEPAVRYDEPAEPLAVLIVLLTPRDARHDPDAGKTLRGRTQSHFRQRLADTGHGAHPWRDRWRGNCCNLWRFPHP